MTQRSSCGTVCRWLTIGFVLAYAAALALFAIGHFRLFGSPSGPLAGIFLVPLGLPWNLLIDSMSPPDEVLLWIGVLSPLINVALIRGVCAVFQR